MQVGSFPCGYPRNLLEQQISTQWSWDITGYSNLSCDLGNPWTGSFDTVDVIGNKAAATRIHFFQPNHES